MRVYRYAALVGATVALTVTSLARADVPRWPVWLCLPGHLPNYCVQNLNTSAILADGSSEVEAIAAAKNPPIDCFYAYPTVSTEHRSNSDLKIQPAEQLTAFLEASPFSQVCRVFAPMYHQVTVFATHGNFTEEYTDVLAAWRDYLAHYNDGRGVVLIGHSEGSHIFEQLLSRQYASVSKVLVSAILLGGDVNVDSHDRFDGQIPACTSLTQTGCIVGYSSWNHTPPKDAKFEGIDQAGDHVLCVNPGAPGGGVASATPVFPWFSTEGLAPRYKSAPVSTLWLSYPGLYTARCVREGTRAWLLVTPTKEAGDTRPTVKGVLAPTWGLHAADVNIALAELVSLVRSEAKAYSAHR
jgi:hypothetical protein